MTAKTLPGGTFTMAEDLTVTRMGYGAMQLAGPGVFGPPDRPRRRRSPCCARRSSWASPTSTPATTTARTSPTRSSRRPCTPTRTSCTSSPRSGRCRDAEGGWPHARSPEQLRQAVHDNLDHLGLDALDVVNLRVGGFDSPEPGSIAEPFDGARRAAAGRTDQASRRQHGLRRADRRGAVHRAGRVRAELLQPRPPRRRRPDRLPRRAGHRLRALLPARWLHPAAVRHARVGRRSSRRDTDGRRAGLAAAALAEHPADPRHLVRRAPARERQRRRARPSPRTSWPS